MKIITWGATLTLAPLIPLDALTEHTLVVPAGIRDLAGNTLAVEVLRFPTQELLEGQINGRALVVVDSGSVVNDPPPEKDDDTTADTPQTGDGSGYMEIYDYSDALVMSVPETWNDIESFDWENTWELGNGSLLDFVAADLIAAPSLDDFYDFIYGFCGASAFMPWKPCGSEII